MSRSIVSLCRHARTYMHQNHMYIHIHVCVRVCILYIYTIYISLSGNNLLRTVGSGCQGVLIRNVQSISYHRSAWGRIAAKRIPNIQSSSHDRHDIDFLSDILEKCVLIRKPMRRLLTTIIKRYLMALALTMHCKKLVLTTSHTSAASGPVFVP